jgi:hypothetical protein
MVGLEGSSLKPSFFAKESLKRFNSSTEETLPVFIALIVFSLNSFNEGKKKPSH